MGRLNVPLPVYFIFERFVHLYTLRPLSNSALKDPMIYQNSRPITRHANPDASKRRFEWRDFLEGNQDSEALIRERFEFDKKETRLDRFFLLPGRRGQIAKMNDNEIFEIKTLINEEGPLEVWETTVKSEVPMRRTLARTIASRIPKFSGPIIGSMTAEELDESLSRKTRYFRVNAIRETFRLGGISARISRTHVNDTHALSISFVSAHAEPLLAELKTLGLRKRANTNVGEFLLNRA